ncbi:YeiH family protein [Desulfitobacterium sp. AusDCA]|uniref:YeiH family protein n=1 Tax=Desulfitobacterium sp. AusDCA TaxID=3240383 RepID=UPI003DA71782
MLQQNDMAMAVTSTATKKWMNPQFYLGILFTLIIAAAGTAAANLPVLNHIGGLLTAILIAVLYRNIFSYPEDLRTGIQFSAQKLLRFAIVLYGFKLNIDIVLHQGGLLLVHDTLSIIVAIATTLLLAKFFKADMNLSLLLGIGTGVCGAAAIAAISPIVKAEDEDTAIGAGIIALMGTLFAITYALIRPFLPLTPTQFGIWSGISLHEIAHVAAAAAPAGTNALAMGLLAKLGRVFLLIPLSLILSLWMRRKDRNESAKSAPFPWFLVGFLATSIVGTYFPIPKNILFDISNVIGPFLLAAAMVGLGLNVHLSNLRSRALRPLLAMFIASIILSAFSYFTLWF